MHLIKIVAGLVGAAASIANGAPSKYSPPGNSPLVDHHLQARAAPNETQLLHQMGVGPPGRRLPKCYKECLYHIQGRMGVDVRNVTVGHFCSEFDVFWFYWRTFHLIPCFRGHCQGPETSDDHPDSNSVKFWKHDTCGFYGP